MFDIGAGEMAIAVAVLALAGYAVRRLLRALLR
jgi:hypothetical protein